jgi:hypothetical protein
MGCWAKTAHFRPYHYSRPYHGAKMALAGSCMGFTAALDVNVNVNFVPGIEYRPTDMKVTYFLHTLPNG